MHISTQAAVSYVAQGGQSPTSPNSTQRKLHARRGSLSAPDPLNLHSTETTAPRVAASRLSIITLPHDDTTLEQVIDGAFSPTSPVRNAHNDQRRGARTFGVGGSFARQRSNSSNSQRNRSMSPARISFANASFNPNTNANGPIPQSPTTVSSSGHRRRTSSTSSIYHPGNPRLTAEQVYELATATCNPVVSRTSDEVNAIRQLSMDEFLPFVDRPVEVSALLVEGKSAKLYQMISQLLPSGSTDVTASPRDIPPSDWNSSHLTYWLTKTSRQEVPDVFWVRKLYQVIYPHSPPLWERLKGLLGVPLGIEFTNDGTPGSVPFSERQPSEEFMFEEIVTHAGGPLTSNGDLGGITEDVIEDSSSGTSSSSSTSVTLNDSVRGLCIIASSTPNPQSIPHSHHSSVLSVSSNPSTSSLHNHHTSHKPSRLRHAHTPNNSISEDRGPSAEELRTVRERRNSVSPHFVADFAHLGRGRTSLGVEA